MALTIQQEKYKGQLLFLRLGYGWGWLKGGELADYQPIEDAGPCHVRVKRLLSMDDELRGVIGLVEEKGHLFDGMWVICIEMHAGVHNFMDNICFRYDLEIGPTKPLETEQPHIEAHESRYTGYGILAESEQHIRQAFENAPKP